MLKLWIAGGLALVAAGVALADGPRGGMFKRVDGNGDGQLSRAEVMAFGEKRFARADANTDGNLTLEEVTKAMGKRDGARIAKRFQRLDTNGDGMIGQEEFRARGTQRFERLDADGDGMVSVDEARKARRGWRAQNRDG